MAPPSSRARWSACTAGLDGRRKAPARAPLARSPISVHTARLCAGRSAQPPRDLRDAQPYGPGFVRCLPKASSRASPPLACTPPQKTSNQAHTHTIPSVQYPWALPEGRRKKGRFFEGRASQGCEGRRKREGGCSSRGRPSVFFSEGFGQIPPQRFFWFSGRRGECTRRPTKRPVQGAVTVSRCAARRVRCSSARPSFSSLFLQRAMPPPLARSCSAIHAWFARQVCHTAHPRPF